MTSIGSAKDITCRQPLHRGMIGLCGVGGADAFVVTLLTKRARVSCLPAGRTASAAHAHALVML